MSFDSDAATIQRLEALAHDQQYLRMNTLRMAGSILQTSEQDVVEQLFNELDKDIVGKGSDLYSAYEALYAAIAREVVEVGRELSLQATKGAAGTK
jgi:predicted metal-dependent HD superfamily phosphohydrolase